MVTGVWRYQLFPVGGHLPPREGALIRHEVAGGVGYADLHPWPELGDEPLEAQLQAIKERRETSLTFVNQAVAAMDAADRHKERPMVLANAVPSSHASLPYALKDDSDLNRFTSSLDEFQPYGFELLKVKLDPGSEGEVSKLEALVPIAIERGLRLRLDLNCQGSSIQVFRLLQRLRDMGSPNLVWLDWVEDPMPWNVEDWVALKEAFGVRLALDLAAPLEKAKAKESFARAVDVVIIKPAAQIPSLRPDVGEASIAITSYLDHPLGQVWAAAAASSAASGSRLEPGGLCSHLAYEPNEFSERLGIRDGKLVPPQGIGLGFDDLLENLPWEAP